MFQILGAPYSLKITTNSQIEGVARANGSVTLTETDWCTDSNLDSKPDGYYAEHVYIAQIQTQIPTPYFCKGQKS